MTHLKRWITSIVAIPILLLIIGTGPRWLLYVLVSLTSIVALYEFLRITSPRLPRSVVIFYLLLCGLVPISAGGRIPEFLGLFPLCIFFIWALYLFFFAPERPHIIDELGKISLGFIYVNLPLSLLITIDLQPQGKEWIFFLLAVVFSGDVGAMYAGLFLGKHKLYPAISPGKTWEGSLGGFMASLLAALLFALLVFSGERLLSLLVIGACLSVASQIGDLSESMLKRAFGVKDSGTILPGHGGMLDRIDGLLFSIPVLYLYLTCFHK